MSDVEIITKYINDNLHLLNNINHISEEHITSTICRIVTYNNHLYENKIKKDIQLFRYYIFFDYHLDNNPYTNLYRIFLYHIVNKYYDYFKNITFTTEIKNFLINSINDCNNYNKLCIKDTISISNKSGLNLFEIYKLLQHYHEIELYPTTVKTIDSLLDAMCYLEDKNKEYGLFRFPVIGANNCSHCNLFLFDKKLSMWYRIEPVGTYFSEEDNDNITYQYYGIDKKIKEIKTNYMSHNDYYFLPGLHFINPGPYCAYYSVMIVDEYIRNGFHNMIHTIEKVSDVVFIKGKFEEYEKIV
jgi:hypothetical protein